jgi:hypothetical protein
MPQLLGEIDMKSEAKKGINELMLLHVRGNINIDSMSIISINPASPLRGMQVVLNQPRTERAAKFADLMWMTLDLAKQQVYTTIHSLQVFIRVISKVLESRMLQGNFAKKKVTRFELEANLIEPSSFLPQNNACLIECEKNNKVKAMLENVMDFSNSHKTKGKTMISFTSMMISMPYFSSLCINMNTIITTVCSSNKPQKILRQILLNFVAIINNPDWVH